MTKGEVCWYKYNKRIYCFAVLEVTKSNDYLIAISEEIAGFTGKPNLEEAINTNLYTIAWFNDFTLLPCVRTHLISKVCISDDYSNRAGIWIDDNKYINRNPGDVGMWRHERRLFAINNIKIIDTFSSRYIPKTYLPRS